MDKLQQLENLLGQLGSCLVAYSGGVDSAFLALVAHRTLGDQSLAVMADSPSLPRSEFKDAIALSEQFGFPLKIIQTKEFENEEYLSNPNNRCYFCKHALFEETESLAMERGVAAVLYGEIADDIGDFRPGAQAAKEFQVRAPMKEVGLTKSEIRVYSSEMGLPTASKPQMACLSSRIPYGEKVTVKKLSQIEEAEALLRKLGFHDIRVRHHELSQGALARIEIGSAELDQLVQPAIRETLTQSIKSLGYLYVTLDLMGYQRGSLNSARQASSDQPFS
ncbi:ATP-dependent sacrificial sulfur transferase LarE [Verrucomicrobia bacterium]|nr:ATP-dependent sacrificial sulfur transferase LarE [Verrucomicrobiota bacterium]MDA7682153.1 ATP-dependent sacrificial sulfur transferase LarE [bacterium]MDB4705903.1 ATP-dependent sacrificial sulfur transferase LarE [Verrucomicrobiota bacterium]MDB4777173.1 ATP-dependent sacrificial sulfur transferase LarE [Verrucomicrobiota bacterium]MDB4795664.1 ATP-dependent sacrificial sulfur transferase LarE [Verrucomicrobiota bacterium]